MTTRRPPALIAPLLAGLALSSASAAQETLLQITGQPYFDGDVTIRVSAPDAVGSPAVLAYGLDALATPVPIGIKGPWYIGQLASLLYLGAVPTQGRIDVPLTMPPEDSLLIGLPVVFQAFVPPFLSNPAILRCDLPYLTVADAVEVLPPLPVAGANFGDRVEAGDFDGDGHVDLAVGAAFESYQGIWVAGSAYVLWGPDWTAYTELRPPQPGVFNAFGGGLAVADYDQDGLDDLVISEIATDPPDPSDYGHIYAVFGAGDRQLAIQHVATSPASGIEAASFGRFLATGDVTNDGIPDVVVGADATAVGGTVFSGAIMILPGPTLDQPIVIPNPTPVDADFFGNSLVVFDVDGDGDLDIVEGSGRADVIDPQTQQVIVNAGEMHIGYGPDFTTWAPLHSPAGSKALDRFGDIFDVADLDRDGLAEIGTTDNHDTAFILWGGGGSTSFPKPTNLLESPFSGSSFGYAVLFFDANGDGLDDLLLGDPFDGLLAPCSVNSSGTVWVSVAPYYATFAILEFPDAGCGDQGGWPLKSRDAGGDLVPDVLMGIPLSDSSGTTNAGKILVFSWM